MQTGPANIFIVQNTDAGFNLVSTIDNYETLTFSRSFFNIGSFSFSIMADSMQAQYVTVDSLAIIGESFGGKQLRIGTIQSVDRSISQDGKRVLTATGFEAKGILSWRTVDPGATDRFTATGSFETVTKHLVNDQCGSTVTIPARAFPGFTVSTDQGLGTSYTYSERWSNLSEAIQRACIRATVGFQVYWSGTGLVFDTIFGVDRTLGNGFNNPAVFSTDFDTVKESHHTLTKQDYKNYNYVGGQGVGVDRTIRELYPTGESTPTGFFRREIFTDARDISSNADLDVRGAETLAERSYQSYVETIINPYATFSQSSGADLGDLVTVESFGVSQTSRITEITELWSSAGYDCQFVMDKNLPTIQSVMSGQTYQSNRLQAFTETPTEPYISDVATDATIDGDGTTISPLSINVGTDATLTGDGKAATPLSVAIARKVDDSGLAGYWSMDGVPEIPDNVAGRSYIQDAWATVDIWDNWGGHGVLSVANGTLINTYDTTSTQYYRAIFTSTMVAGEIVIIKIKASKNTSTFSVKYFNGSYVDIISGYTINTDYKYISITLPENTDYLVMGITDGTTGTTITIDTVYIGSGLYDTPLIDNSGNSNHGTIHGATPVPGISGNGLSFNGVNSYVHSASAKMLVKSISFWAKWNGVVANPIPLDLNGKFIGYGDQGGGYPTASIAGYFATLAMVVAKGTTFYADNLWHLFVLNIGGGGSNGIYVDGVALDIAFAAGNINTDASFTATEYYLGKYSGGGYFMSGLIDEPRIYDRALTLAEIKDLYERPGGAITGMVRSDQIIDRPVFRGGVTFASMTTNQRDDMINPHPGMVIFNTTTSVLNFYDGANWGAV